MDRIVDEILKIEKAEYEYKGELSSECNNVICGHAIDSFEKFYEKTNNQKKIMAFVKRQLNNTRPSVKKRAEKFIKKWFHWAQAMVPSDKKIISHIFCTFT